MMEKIGTCQTMLQKYEMHLVVLPREVKQDHLFSGSAIKTLLSIDDSGAFVSIAAIIVFCIFNVGRWIEDVCVVDLCQQQTDDLDCDNNNTTEEKALVMRLSKTDRTNSNLLCLPESGTAPAFMAQADASCDTQITTANDMTSKLVSISCQ